jgi:hypothetical protein
MLLEPVPGRECGPCNVCCRVPTIIEPALKKPPGVLCPHWAFGTGCTVYGQRSGPCRSHFCAWRRIEQLDDCWRPDRINIYAEVKTEPNERFQHLLPEAPFALKFTVLGNLDEQQLALLMATAASLIANDVPVIVAVAAPPGYMGGYRLVNAELKAVADGPDFAEPFVQILRDLIAVPPLAVSLA